MLKKIFGLTVILAVICGLSAPLFAETVLVGDIDGDWVVSSSDARKILEYAESGTVLPDHIRAVADIDGDGAVTAEDARLALRYALDGTERQIEVEIPADNDPEVGFMCLAVGETFDLKNFVKFPVSAWKSSDTAVAAVENGQIVAKKFGSCEISASSGGLTYTLSLRVAPAVSEDAPIQIIDVASHQGKIDFEAVRDSGVTAVIVRLGVGNFAKNPSQKDSRFDENVRAAYEAGLDVGVYVYSYAENTAEATAEAMATIDALKDLGGMITYPVFFDYEEYILGKQLGTEVITTFCSLLRDAGWYSAVYASASVFFYNLDLAALRDYDFWVAAYGPDDGTPYETAVSRFLGKGEYGLWQYTSKGSVDGIATIVDMNFCYTGFPKKIINGGYNGFCPEGLPEPPSEAQAYAASVASLSSASERRFDAIIPEPLMYRQSADDEK